MSIVENGSLRHSGANVPIGLTPSTTQISDISQQPSNSNTSGTNTPKQTPSSATKPKRLDVEPISSEMLRILGMELWIRYQRILNLFIIGKRSRIEFQTVLEEIFNEGAEQQEQTDHTDGEATTNNFKRPAQTVGLLRKLHNQLLLLNLSNSLREPPAEPYLVTTNFTLSRRSLDSQANGGNAGNNSQSMKQGKSKSNKSSSSQYEKLKKIIMSLPIRERHRIKTIQRDSGKRSMSNSSLTLTRQALLPKTPYRNIKDPSTAVNNNIEWTHDISVANAAPLSSETYTLPDSDNLSKRMLGIAREHGLVGTIDPQAVELVSLGLQDYLKGIIEAGIDTVRFRRRKWDDLEDEEEETNGQNKKQKLSKKRKVIMTNEDIIDTLEIAPFLVDPGVPVYQLHSVKLKDDCYIEGEEKFHSVPSSLTVKSEQISANNKIMTNILSSGTNTPISSPLMLKKEVGGNTNSPLQRNGSVNSSPLIGNRPLENKVVNEGTKEELKNLIEDILNGAIGW